MRYEKVCLNIAPLGFVKVSFIYAISFNDKRFNMNLVGHKFLIDFTMVVQQHVL